MMDQSPDGAEERRATKLLARKERKARRNQERLAGEAGRVSQATQAPRPRPQKQIAPVAGPLGPLGRRVGRIAWAMVIRQALRFLFRSVLRR
jgi:hypothetical protein